MYIVLNKASLLSIDKNDKCDETRGTLYNNTNSVHWTCSVENIWTVSLGWRHLTQKHLTY